MLQEFMYARQLGILEMFGLARMIPLCAPGRYWSIPACPPRHFCMQSFLGYSFAAPLVYTADLSCSSQGNGARR